MGCLLFEGPNNMDLLQGENPQNIDPYRGGVWENVAFGVQKL